MTTAYSPVNHQKNSEELLQFFVAKGANRVAIWFDGHTALHGHIMLAENQKGLTNIT